MDHIDPGRLTWLCLVCETPAAMKDELRLAVAIKTVFCAPFQQSHYNSGFTRMSSRGAVCMRAHQREGKCFQPEDVVAKSWPWDASKGWGISLFLIQNGWLLMCHSSRPVDVQAWYNKPSIKHHILQYKVLCADNTGVLDFIYCYFYPENRQDCLLSIAVCSKRLPMKCWRSYNCDAEEHWLVHWLPVWYKFAGRFSLNSGAANSFATICVDGDN